MAQDGTELVVAGAGGVYVADVGETEPTDIDAAIPSGWTELGFITEDGVRFSFGSEIQEFFAWQSLDPVRKSKLRAPKTISFDLMQWNAENLMLAFGGGTWTEDSGKFEYTPADDSFLDERALMVEATDGDRTYRFLFRRTINTQGVSFAFTRNANANLPLTFDVLAVSGDDSWIILSDDANLTAAASA